MRRDGIMVLSIFAALWFVWGLAGVGEFPAPVLLLPTGISGGLILAARRLPRDTSAEELGRRGRVVGVASMAEFAAIFLANLALGLTGHSGFAVCATALLVGLHFLPLAYYLPVPRYYASGVALVALAGAGCAVGDSHTRLMLVGFGSALVLWATCLPVPGRRVLQAA